MGLLPHRGLITLRGSELSLYDPGEGLYCDLSEAEDLEP